MVSPAAKTTVWCVLARMTWARSATQVHFDASKRLVIQRDMLEVRQVKIGPEFAVDAFQEVEVEGRGDALCIIVGRDEESRGFFQVNAQQEDIIRPHQVSRPTQELFAFLHGKIPQAGAKEGNGFAGQLQVRMTSGLTAKSACIALIRICRYSCSNCCAVSCSMAYEISTGQ